MLSFHYNFLHLQFDVSGPLTRNVSKSYLSCNLVLKPTVALNSSPVSLFNEACIHIVAPKIIFKYFHYLLFVLVGKVF